MYCVHHFRGAAVPCGEGWRRWGGGGEVEVEGAEEEGEVWDGGFFFSPSSGG